MTSMTWRRVRDRRLAIQRLSSAGLACGADVVRGLLAVQAQDAPLALWSVAQRVRGEPTAATLLAEQAAGGWVRTHVLRPTWHLVAPEDLRWLQRLTGPKVEASAGARHRQLELDERARGRAVETLVELLSPGVPMTRREISAAFASRGLPASGEQVGHQLWIAEVRCVIASGPPRGAEHTYVLVDATIPPSPHDGLEGEEARRELVRRFVEGHGPVGERDLARWCTLTLTEIRAALAELGDVLEPVQVGDRVLWTGAAPAPRATRRPDALLLPTFDEVTLTYLDSGFVRRDPESPRARLVSEHGGGTVVVGDEDLGTWKRRVVGDTVEVRVRPDVPLPPAEVEAVEVAAGRLARVVGGELRFTLDRP